MHRGGFTSSWEVVAAVVKVVLLWSAAAADSMGVRREEAGGGGGGREMGSGANIAPTPPPALFTAHEKVKIIRNDYFLFHSPVEVEGSGPLVETTLS